MKIFDTKTYKRFYNQRGRAGRKRKNFPVYSRDKTILLTQLEYKQSEKKFYHVKKILTFLNQNLRRAMNREGFDLEVDIDLDYVFKIGEDQEWHCSLTGDKLEFQRGGTNWLGKWCNPKSCTIDRIDSSKGYVKENIQLITWEANCLKQHLDNNEFIDFCKRVYLNT
jgi:hypothetical protein